MNRIQQIFSPPDLYNPEYANVAIAFGLLIAGFAAYHFLSLLLTHKMKKWEMPNISFASAISQRILGFVFFGLIPLLIFYSFQNLRFQNYGINVQNFEQSLIWLGLFAPLILLVNFFMAGKESNLQHYPQIRIKHWDTRSLIINFTTWLIYLFAYEAFFRGLLLFSLYYTFGIATAIVVNIILYALAHIPKGRKEMIGSVPFGLILCLITFHTGSFFAAFMIHGLMAISYELFSIMAHPEMSIKNKIL